MGKRSTGIKYPLLQGLMSIPGREHEGEETLGAVIMKGQGTQFPGRDRKEKQNKNKKVQDSRSQGSLRTSR